MPPFIPDLVKKTNFWKMIYLGVLQGMLSVSKKKITHFGVVKDGNGFVGSSLRMRAFDVER